MTDFLTAIYVIQERVNAQTEALNFYGTQAPEKEVAKLDALNMALWNLQEYLRIVESDWDDTRTKIRNWPAIFDHRQTQRPMHRYRYSNSDKRRRNCCGYYICCNACISRPDGDE